MVVTLPAALLILQWWKNGRITLPDLRRVTPFFLVALLLTAVDLYSYGSSQGALDYSLPERILIAARALWFYAGKLVWPANLAVIYTRWDISLGDPRAWLTLAGAAALAATLWFLRHRLGRGPLAGALFFAVTLSPVLGFVNHGYMDYSLVADRFQYLAGIGVMAVLIGAAVHGAGRLQGRLKWGAAGLVVVVLALLGTITWRQAGIYRDKITFFSHIVSLNPEARSAHFNLSHALGRAGRTEEALAPARMAVEQRPNDARALCMLGSVLIHMEKFAEAEDTLRRALDIDPGHKCSRREMAHMLRMQGHLQEALEAYRALLEIYPNYALAYALHRPCAGSAPSIRRGRRAPEQGADNDQGGIVGDGGISQTRVCSCAPGHGLAGAGADRGGGGALPASPAARPAQHGGARPARRGAFQAEALPAGAQGCIESCWSKIPTRQPLTPTSA